MLRTFIAGLLLMVMIFMVTKMPFWIAPVSVIAAHLAFLILRRGTVKIKSSGNANKTIAIRRAGSTMSLTPPIKWKRWWCYLFQSYPDAEIGNDFTTIGLTGNDLHVHLKLTDASQKEVVFQEYIGFDGRFPNECPHSPDPLPPKTRVIRVLRTDRLFDFFEENLEGGEFVKEES